MDYFRCSSLILKTLIHPFFWIFLFVFLINQLIENFGYQWPFLHSYLDDFLFIPLFLFGFKFLVRAYVPHQQNYKTPFALIILSVAIFSFFFELSGIGAFDYNVPDGYDILAYASGGLCFYFLFNS